MSSLATRDHNIYVNKAFLLIIPPILSGGIAISFRIGSFKDLTKILHLRQNWSLKCALWILFEPIPGGLVQRTKEG